MLYYKHYEFENLILYIIQEDNYIISISSHPFNCEKEEETTLLKEANLQLKQYFRKKRETFELPIKLYGTAFQNRVWNELINIPYGQTKSYGEIAKDIDNPKASRAVGKACNRNPIMIVIPCHRVVGKSGNLVGYESGIELKKRLLELEKIK